MTIAPLTPAATHSRITSGTVAAGVTTTARSTGSGSAPTEGYARHAEDVGALRVDRVNRAAERVTDEVPEDCAADAPEFLRRADDRDGSGREDRLQGLAMGEQHASADRLTLVTLGSFTAAPSSGGGLWGISVPQSSSTSILEHRRRAGAI